MKICHVVSGYQRTDARVVVRQCGSLIAAGHEVILLTNDGGTEEEKNGLVIKVTKKKWPRWKQLIFAYFQFASCAKEVDADVYQLHSPELLPLSSTLRRFGKRVIYDAHEDMPAHILEKDWIPKILRYPISYFMRVYMNWEYKRVDEVISPHDHVISRCRNEAGKGIVIANFPLIKDPIFRSQSDLTSGVFCYTGTVYSYSNQDMIVDVVSQIDGASYEVAGVIDSEYRRRLEDRSSETSVRFHGHVAHDQLREIYRRSVAGLALYDYKLNLGWNRGSYATNKIFEYMEAGIPVVCTDFTLWEELVVEHDCGLVVSPGDADGLRAALEYLLENPSEAARMGENGRKAVLEKFNWVSEEQRYLNLFSKLELLA